MEILLIALAAFVGGILAWFLGWVERSDEFILKKFVSSLVRAVFASLAFAIGYSYIGDITLLDIGLAVLGGAGIDVIGNRAAGALSNFRR